MAGEQLFSKFVIKGGGKTFTEQSTILIFRQKPIRLIVVNAAVIETYTVKKCTNRSRCAHGIYSLTMILKKNAKYRLFDFIQVKAKAGNTGIGIGLCHRKHLIHYGSESPCRIQNNSLNNFAKVICVFRVTHHEIVDGAVLQTELLRVCLDDFTYQMLEMNPNSMGFWFPPLVEGLYGSAFFKVPDTKILRVPITMLQLTRLGFETLNPVTKEIVNRYCQKVFHLDGYEDYFIKTGTYSSKYEFRNAHIHNPKEINEMGEYFLFLNHLTCSMASPLNNRCFYGANTTNEWVVREYIKDKENNPTIYNGLPLHTEYRVFVDFDTKEILGASPYWRSDVMKNEFKKVSSPQERHDYVVYKMYEDILNQRYHESVQTVLAELKKVIPRIELTGQWSVDVMRNGNDYYIIDMALAENSALNDCVPKNLLRAYPQQWLPGESNS